MSPLEPINMFKSSTSRKSMPITNQSSMFSHRNDPSDFSNANNSSSKRGQSQIRQRSITFDNPNQPPSGNYITLRTNFSELRPPTNPPLGFSRRAAGFEAQQHGLAYKSPKSSYRGGGD